jgi:hypothetical protein
MSGSGRAGGGPPHAKRHRLAVIVGSFAMAIAAGLIVPRVIPAPANEIVSLGVIWAAFYPVARLNPAMPWWAHWSRGVVVLLGAMFAQYLLQQ